MSKSWPRKKKKLSKSCQKVVKKLSKRCHTCHKYHLYVSLVIKCVIGGSLVTNFNQVQGGCQKVKSRPLADSFAVGRRQKGNFGSSAFVVIRIHLYLPGAYRAAAPQAAAWAPAAALCSHSSSCLLPSSPWD
jgi:hypothetical protein